jgi:hypothetical protein
MRGSSSTHHGGFVRWRTLQTTDRNAMNCKQGTLQTSSRNDSQVWGGIGYSRSVATGGSARVARGKRRGGAGTDRIGQDLHLRAALSQPEKSGGVQCPDRAVTTGSCTEPSSSTASWDARMLNFAPSVLSAFSRARTIASSPRYIPRTEILGLREFSEVSRHTTALKSAVTEPCYTGFASRRRASKSKGRVSITIEPSGLCGHSSFGRSR